VGVAGGKLGVNMSRARAGTGTMSLWGASHNEMTVCRSGGVMHVSPSPARSPKPKPVILRSKSQPPSQIGGRVRLLPSTPPRPPLPSFEQKNCCCLKSASPAQRSLLSASGRWHRGGLAPECWTGARGVFCVALSTRYCCPPVSRELGCLCVRVWMNQPHIRVPARLTNH
jgi:hypothetical protein